MLETGTVIFFWCMVAVAGLAAVCLMAGLASKSEFAWIASGVLTGIFVIGAILAAFIYFPYNLKYQTWETKEAVVVSSEYTREVGSGRYNDDGGLKITLSDGTVGYTTDFRLAKYQRGDKATMLCKAEYVHNNVDRHQCRALTGG
jgi:hypothetical protein